MASKATLTSVGDEATSTSLIAANPDRTGLLLTNTSSAILYIKLGGGTATATTAHSWRIAASGGQLDLSNFSGRCFKGAITGIWASDAGGAVNITELE